MRKSVVSHRYSLKDKKNADDMSLNNFQLLLSSSITIPYETKFPSPPQLHLALIQRKVTFLPTHTHDNNMVIFSSMHFVSTICWNFNVTLPFDVSCCSNQQLTWICCVGVERKEQSVYYRHLTVSCKIEWHSKCIYVECGRGRGMMGR